MEMVKTSQDLLPHIESRITNINAIIESIVNGNVVVLLQ